MRDAVATEALVHDCQAVKQLITELIDDIAENRFTHEMAYDTRIRTVNEAIWDGEKRDGVNCRRCYNHYQKQIAQKLGADPKLPFVAGGALHLPGHQTL